MFVMAYNVFKTVQGGDAKDVPVMAPAGAAA
jgi:hypothetical protein